MLGAAGAALQDWLQCSGIAEGRIFRRILKGGHLGGPISPAAVRGIVQLRCALAGIEGDFSAHSLRSGFVTEAGRQDVSLADTMALTGHQSIPAVMGYYRAESTVLNRGARLLDEEKGKAKGKTTAAAKDPAVVAAEERRSMALGKPTDKVPEPASVASAKFVESRLLSVRADSAVYKGIFALVMGRGAKDWRANDEITAHNFVTTKIGFHQIFPSAYCFTHGINPVLADSVLNRTPMAEKTDHMIGETDPARYLPRVQGKSLLGDKEFDKVLAGHLLEPKLLHHGKVDEFFLDRRHKLLKMVEEAMGRKAVHDVDDSDLAAGEEGPNAFFRALEQ